MEDLEPKLPAVRSIAWLDIKRNSSSRFDPTGPSSSLVHSDDTSTRRCCPPVGGFEDAPPVRISIHDTYAAATKQIAIVPGLLAQPSLCNPNGVAFVFSGHGDFRSNETKLSYGCRERATNAVRKK
jgi:hypothetical protein